MYVDLLTLYLLATGTLLVSAGMLYWEHRSNPARSTQLRIFAAAFATLAVGCASVLVRKQMPGALGSAFSNLVILTGYLLILSGVASFAGRWYARFSVGLLVFMAIAWAMAGIRWQDTMWNYITSIPIALISGLTAFEALRCKALSALPSKSVIVLVTGAHAVFYTSRAVILPWLVSQYGSDMLVLFSKITIYEGVLYSVVLPMTLLKLVREESHARLLQESQTDYLTQLGNRRWFFEEGSRRVTAKPQGPTAVLAFDLDQFKLINDRYGHQAGDDVLKSFAHIVSKVLGADALIARIGGEEFAALLHGQPARHAETLGDMVATQLARTIATRLHDQDVLATVSIGLAYYDNDAPPLAQSLAAADKALYRAKSAGGNRLVRA